MLYTAKYLFFIFIFRFKMITGHQFVVGRRAITQLHFDVMNQIGIGEMRKDTESRLVHKATNNRNDRIWFDIPQTLIDLFRRWLCYFLNIWSLLVESPLGYLRLLLCNLLTEISYGRKMICRPIGNYYRNKPLGRKLKSK